MNTTASSLPRARSSLGSVFLLLFLDAAGFSIIFPLLPTLLAYYLRQDAGGLLAGLHGWIDHVTATSAGGGERFTEVLFAGVIGSIYALLQFLMAPLWGSLSDRHGRRRILLFTCAGIAASYGLWFFASTFDAFLLARLLGGALAGNFTVARAVIADVTTPENRARGMGAFGAALGLGFICGPALGLLCDWAAARYPEFAATLPHPFALPALLAASFALINLFWVATRLRETLPESSRVQRVRWRDRLGLTAWFSIEDGRIRRANALYLVYSIAFAAMESTLTFLGVERFGYGVRENAGLVIFVGAMMILTQGLLVRRFVPRWGEVRATRVGLALVAIGLGLLAWAPAPGWMFAALAFTATGAGFANASLSALVSLYARPQEQGRVSGVFGSLASLARAGGPLLGGACFWWAGASANYGTAAAVVLLAAAFAWTLPRAAPPPA